MLKTRRIKVLALALTLVVMASMTVAADVGARMNCCSRIY